MTRGASYRLFLAALLAALAPAGVCQAQAAWEYTPYEVRIRIALEPTPQLPAATVATIADSVAARSDTVLGAIWHVETAAAEPALRNLLLHSGDDLTAEHVAAMAPAVDLAADKLFLASIVRHDLSLQVTVREFDCRTRQLGPSLILSASSPQSLPLVLWDAIVDLFTPLARIEHVDQSRVTARLRAAGLATDKLSPALVEEGSALRPIVRRNDRTGQPAKLGIQAPPWTLLTVTGREGAILDCTLQSGFRNPVPSRGGVRLDRLALAIRPRYEATQLFLRSRTNPAKPLVGYEIHTRAAADEEPELLGLTDVYGAFELPAAAGSLKLLYVRNGRQLLARLPIVPGQEETVTATIVDDDNRLAAEGYIDALASRALDLVARREILAARIRARVKAGQLAEAQKLLDDFRKLQSRADLSRDLDQFRRRLNTPDSLTQQRIDKLFADAQKLFQLRPLSDDLLTELTREVASPRAAAAPSTSAPLN
jgi:hypothetical protein